MADEPSNGELGRRLDNITLMLQNLVGTREYSEFQRYVERRFAEHDSDIADERKVRKDAFDEIRAEQSSARSTNRIAILTGIGTLLGGIALAIFTNLVHLGGH